MLNRKIDELLRLVLIDLIKRPNSDGTPSSIFSKKRRFLRVTFHSTALKKMKWNLKAYDIGNKED